MQHEKGYFLHMIYQTQMLKFSKRSKSTLVKHCMITCFPPDEVEEIDLKLS